MKHNASQSLLSVISGHALALQCVNSQRNILDKCGLPLNEAHGGYTYCGIAALILLKKSLDDIDLKSLMYWTTSRQMELEGGCQGRTVFSTCS